MTIPAFVPQNDADALAWDIARAFQDELHLAQYRRICATHDRSVVYMAYKDAMAVPFDKVRKSRKAIFFGILRDYDTR